MLLYADRVYQHKAKPSAPKHCVARHGGCNGSRMETAISPSMELIYFYAGPPKQLVFGGANDEGGAGS
jgi:hypothetical protein